VTGNDWKLAAGELAIRDVQISAAHPAGVYLDQQLPATGPGHRQIGEHQRLVRRRDLHCSHLAGA
jgi:hypothetical protein